MHEPLQRYELLAFIYCARFPDYARTLNLVIIVIGSESPLGRL
jgi:hypothetical protein